MDKKAPAEDPTHQEIKPCDQMYKLKKKKNTSGELWDLLRFIRFQTLTNKAAENVYLKPFINCKRNTKILYLKSISNKTHKNV